MRYVTLPLLDLRPVVVGFLERHVVARRVGDQVEQALRDDGDAAVARVVALELRGERHVEIGRRDQQLVLALGAQQDVGEHRHRALAVGDALREAQPAKELVFACGSWLPRPSWSLYLISKRKILLEVVVSRRCE